MFYFLNMDCALAMMLTRKNLRCSRICPLLPMLFVLVGKLCVYFVCLYVLCCPCGAI